MHKTLLLAATAITGAVLGAIITALVITNAAFKREPARPQIAGQTLDTKPIQINFERSLDLYLSPYSGERDHARIIRSCKILGLVGDPSEVTNRGSYKTYTQFANWLCVELDDGRRTYFPSSDVEYFVESEPPSQPE